MALSDPTRMAGASIVGLDAPSVQALDLMQRPTINIPIPTLSTARQLIGGMGILAGIQLRESSFAASGITYLSASAANAAAANNVTLPGAAGATTYVTGFEVTGDGATAGSIIAVTLTGIVGGTATYYITVPAGAGTAIVPLTDTFLPYGLPASAVNTPITLNVPSFGAGNTNAAAIIRGYQQTLGTAAGTTVTTPAVTGDILDGLDVNGELIMPLDMPPFGLINQGLGPHGPLFKRGIFFNLTAGTIRGALWVKM